MEYSKLVKTISNYCAQRERSLKEVKDKLAGWNVDSATASQIIAMLYSDSLLNENRYVRSFINDKFRNYHWGKNKIIQALEFQQIDDKLIHNAINEIPEEEYRAVATNVLRHLKNAKNPLSGMISRGFEQELAENLLKNTNYPEI